MKNGTRGVTGNFPEPLRHPTYATYEWKLLFHVHNIALLVGGNFFLSFPMFAGVLTSFKEVNELDFELSFKYIMGAAHPRREKMEDVDSQNECGEDTKRNIFISIATTILFCLF